VFLLILILGQIVAKINQNKRGIEMKLKNILLAGVIIVLFVFWKCNKENDGG